MGRAFVLGCIIAVVSCAPDDAPSEEVVTPRPDERDGDPQRGEPGAQPESIDDHDNRAQPPDAPATDEQSTAGDAAPEDDQPVLAATTSRGSDGYGRSNQCERLQVQIDEDGRRRYKRLRRPWTKADQRRFAQLVGLVAKEMGAEPRLIRAWAMRESTYRPHAMHVLNPDIEAATASWRRLHYSADEETKLQALMTEVGAQDPRYWKAKARLHQVQTFRDNAFLDDIVQFEVLVSDGTRMQGSEPAWAFGYGPFGFNPAYFVPVWDSRAPPWVFCEDDGLVAIITAVWAARTAQRECEAQGFGGSYASVNRRFSRGHCGTVSEHASFRGRARRLGIDPDARAKLGRKWRRTETDRSELRRAMRSKAVTAGLLPARSRPGT